MPVLANISTQETITCPNQADLRSLFPKIRSRLRRDGFCVVQMWDATESPLLEIRKYLGRGQLHIRADTDGIVTISPKATPGDKSIDLSHYLGTSTQAHKPHTDGAYLNGLLWQDSAYRRVGPPALVIIQCVQPAPQGGANIVIDTQWILRDLLALNPEIADILLSPGCVSFCRDDHMAMNVSVYERVSQERWRIRLRCDDALYVMDWAYHAVQHLHRQYLSKPQYQKRIDLKEGQILLLDNFRVLHGRESFSTNHPSTRLFRRAWVHDDSDSSTLINFMDSRRENRAFDRYKSYAATEPNSQTLSSLDLGIRLPHELRAAIDKMPDYLLRQAV